MSDEQSVSRRASLKTLAAAGAAMILGDSAANGQDTQPVNVVDLAAGRMAKGHS